jgi:hypothetical protein
MNVIDCCCVAAFLFIGSPSVAAGSKLDTLIDLAKALGVAGENIGKIGDGFAHLAELGTQGFDTVSARLARKYRKHACAILRLFHQLGLSSLQAQGYDRLRGTYLDNVAQY